jgi:hypothetical protein
MKDMARQDITASIAVLRSLLCGAIFIVLATVLVGSGLNSHGLKYSRSEGTQCNRAVLTLNVPDSHHCCDSVIHQNDWVCKAAFDPVNRIAASVYAYLIALVPMMLNSMIRFLYEEFNSTLARSFSRFKQYILLFFVRFVSSFTFSHQYILEL